MASSIETYGAAFREELMQQTQPDQLPKLLVLAVITGLAIVVARRWVM